MREGIQKHRNEVCPTLEAQIANLADEITYYSHDLDDAIDFEILSAEQLEETSGVAAESRECERACAGGARAGTAQADHQRHDRCAGAGCDHVERAAIAAAGVQTAEDVRRQERPLIRYSDELQAANQRTAALLV